MNKLQLFASGAYSTNENNFALQNFYQENSENLELAKLAYSNHNLIPFWGAGFVGGIYPAWENLLNNIAEAHNISIGFLENFNYDRIADLLIEEIGENNIRAYLQRVFAANPELELSESRQRVRDIFEGCHITTNYDRTIELLPSTQQPPMSVFTPLNLDNRIAGVLQRGIHCIIKIHGDINEPTSIILSQNSYDKYYPKGKRRTNVQTALANTLINRRVIFIGCSLNKDRTLEIIKECAGLGCEFFALLPLAKSTENEKTPEEPLLFDNYREYTKRLNELRDLNIRPIWYPYNQHEYVDYFLDYLSDRDTPISLSEKGDSYTLPDIHSQDNLIPLNFYVGRETIFANIVLDLNQNKIVLISGGPGMGKSELCRQVMRARKEQDKSRIYLTIDCQEVPSLDMLLHEISLTCNPNMDISILRDPNTHLETFALNSVKTMQNNGKVGLFLDNFEFLHDSLPYQQVMGLLKLLSTMHCLEIEILIASRYQTLVRYATVNEIEKINQICELHIVPPLNNAAVRELFRKRISTDHLICAGREFEQVVDCLDGHPLSISITIGLAKNYTCWNGVLNAIQSSPKNMTPLVRTCQVAWEMLRDDEGAKAIWAIMSWSIASIPTQWIYENLDFQQPWRSSIKQLANLNIISEVDGKIHMLVPLKEAYENLEKTDSPPIKQLSRSALWATLIKNMAFDRVNPEITSHLPQILQVMTNMLNEKETCNINEIISLSESLWWYYAFDFIASKEYLDALDKFANAHKILALQACAQRGLGTYYFYRNDCIRALQLFDSAAHLYENIGNKIGLARTLRIKGEMLQSQPDQNETVISLFDKAESLCLEVKYERGLAHVFQSKGKYFYTLKQYNVALNYYDQAELIYSQIEDVLGLAETLRCKGECYSALDECLNALTHLDTAEELYYKLSNKRGLAYTFAVRGDLHYKEKEYEKARYNYSNAAAIFKQIENPIGIASINENYIDSLNHLNT